MRNLRIDLRPNETITRYEKSMNTTTLNFHNGTRQTQLLDCKDVQEHFAISLLSLNNLRLTSFTSNALFSPRNLRPDLSRGTLRSLRLHAVYQIFLRAP